MISDKRKATIRNWWRVLTERGEIIIGEIVYHEGARFRPGDIVQTGLIVRPHFELGIVETERTLWTLEGKETNEPIRSV